MPDYSHLAVGKIANLPDHKTIPASTDLSQLAVRQSSGKVFWDAAVLRVVCALYLI